MNKEVLKRRLREAETVRDNLLHQLVDVVRKVDYYKKIIEDLEEAENENYDYLAMQERKMP